MYRSAKKKLNSARGASVLIALLLFLLCAVVGSVVLTAGTAAAGRLSRAREMDRRYYSVTSAAALLRDVVESESITVERTRHTTYTSVTEYTEDAAGAVTSLGSSTDEHSAYLSTLNGGSVRRGQSLLSDAAISVIFGEEDVVPDESYANETFWSRTAPAPFASYTRELSMAPSAYGSSLDLSGLKVSLRETVQPNGTLVFLLSSDDGGSEQYRLQLTFTPDLDSRVNTATSAQDPQVTEGEGGYTETNISTVTITKTDRLTWSLSDVKKV